MSNAQSSVTNPGLSIHAPSNPPSPNTRKLFPLPPSEKTSITVCINGESVHGTPIGDGMENRAYGVTPSAQGSQAGSAFQRVLKVPCPNREEAHPFVYPEGMHPDDPARAVRVSQEVSPELGAQRVTLQIEENSECYEAWTQRFVAIKEATEADIIHALLDTYRRTGRVIFDPDVQDNIVVECDENNPQRVLVLDAGQAMRPGSPVCAPFFQEASYADRISTLQNCVVLQKVVAKLSEGPEWAVYKRKRPAWSVTTSSTTEEAESEQAVKSRREERIQAAIQVWLAMKITRPFQTFVECLKGLSQRDQVYCLNMMWDGLLNKPMLESVRNQTLAIFNHVLDREVELCQSVDVMSPFLRPTPTAEKFDRAVLQCAHRYLTKVYIRPEMPAAPGAGAAEARHPSAESALAKYFQTALSSALAEDLRSATSRGVSAFKQEVLTDFLVQSQALLSKEDLTAGAVLTNIYQLERLLSHKAWSIRKWTSLPKEFNALAEKLQDIRRNFQAAFPEMTLVEQQVLLRHRDIRETGALTFKRYADEMVGRQASPPSYGSMARAF